jgi:adenylate cyclase
MVHNSRPSLQIDLNEFKLHLHLRGRSQLTLHFNSPSRSFYLSVIALIVNEMKKSGKMKFIPLQEHIDLLALLNETVGGASGSSEKEILLHRIYTKWKDTLPNLEEAHLFKVLGKKKEFEDGTTGKIYSFTDAEKDGWANLFEYMGSHENVRMKFAIDKIEVGFDETSIIFGDYRNGEAWDQFIASLKKEEKEEKEETASAEETAVPKPPVIPIHAPEKRKISWLTQYRWILLVVVIGVVAGAIWKIYWSPAPIDIASVDRMKYPLPDKPSIAVLPFANMSEDPKQDFLCDGMTEEIITALTKVRDLFVISRQSTFFYKGKPVKAKQVSEDLGVRYVLEGSLRRAGDRVRVTVQLVDAVKGNHLWAERYDRELQDIFALQDEITMKILTAIQVELTLGEQGSRVEKYFKGKQGLDCYLKYLEGSKYNLGHNIDTNRIARQIAEEVIEKCPENPAGYVLLAWVHQMGYWVGSGKSPQDSIEKGIEIVKKALAIDDSIARAHALLGNFYALKRDYDKANFEGERAVALDPGDAEAHAWYGMSLVYVGRPEEAIPLYQESIRRNPFASTGYFIHLANALRDAKRFGEAVSAYKSAIQREPNNIFAHLNLAGTYIMMGRENEAHAEAAEVLRINPKFTLEFWAKVLPFKDQAYSDYLISVLRKAGLK